MKGVLMLFEEPSNNNDKLHGSGRRLENINYGITLQITKSADGAGAITAHLY